MDQHVHTDRTLRRQVLDVMVFTTVSQFFCVLLKRAISFGLSVHLCIRVCGILLGKGLDWSGSVVLGSVVSWCWEGGWRIGGSCVLCKIDSISPYHSFTVPLVCSTLRFTYWTQHLNVSSHGSSACHFKKKWVSSPHGCMLRISSKILEAQKRPHQKFSSQGRRGSPSHDWQNKFWEMEQV